MTSSGGMEYRSQGCEYKGPWSAVEDRIVCEMVTTHGVGKIKWSEIAAHLPGRLGKQIRERWLHHLDPNINKAKWTASEDATLIDAHRTNDIRNVSIFVAHTFAVRTLRQRGGATPVAPPAPPAACEFLLTLLERTSSGAHKFKVRSITVTPLANASTPTP